MRKVLTITLIGIVLVAALWFTLNAYEVPLSPQVTAALNPPPDPIPDSQNAYFFLLGYAAVDATDPQAKGETLHKYLDQVSENDGSYAGYAAVFGKEIEFKGDESQLCSIGNSNDDLNSIPQYECIKDASKTAVDRMLDKNALLVSRFLSLDRYNAFQNLLKPRYDVPVIDWRPLLTTNRVLLTRAAIEVRDGHLDQALDWLGRNQRFWRMIMASKDGGVLEKMVAARCMVGNFSLVSEILRTQKLNPAQYDQIGAMLKPFEQGELDLEPTIWYEWRGAAATLRYARKQHMLADELLGDENAQMHHPLLGRLANHFFSYNHQLEKYYAYMSMFVEMDHAPTTQFKQLRQELTARRAALQGDLVWEVLYDPVGNALYRTTVSSDLTPYIARLIDLEGLRRVIGLQLEIARRHLAKDQIASFVAAAGTAYDDPYTGRPMVYFSPSNKLTGFMVGSHGDAGWMPLPI